MCLQTKTTFVRFLSSFVVVAITTCALSLSVWFSPDARGRNALLWYRKSRCLATACSRSHWAWWYNVRWLLPRYLCALYCNIRALLFSACSLTRCGACLFVVLPEPRTYFASDQFAHNRTMLWPGFKFRLPVTVLQRHCLLKLKVLTFFDVKFNGILRDIVRKVGHSFCAADAKQIYLRLQLPGNETAIAQFVLTDVRINIVTARQTSWPLPLASDVGESRKCLKSAQTFFRQLWVGAILLQIDNWSTIDSQWCLSSRPEWKWPMFSLWTFLKLGLIPSKG